MEDLAALCTTLVVMRTGRVVAAGPPQTLRDRFCAGYSLEIHLDHKSAAGADAARVQTARIVALLTEHPALQPAVKRATGILGADKVVYGDTSSASAALTTVSRVASDVCVGLGGDDARLRSLFSALSPTGTGWALQAALSAATRAVTAGVSPAAGVVADAADVFSAWWRTEDSIDALVNRLSAALPLAKVVDRSSGRVLRLSLPPGSYTSIAVVFRLMRGLQEEALPERRASMTELGEPALPAIASFGLSQNSLGMVLERMMDDVPSRVL